jgi:ribosome-associated GTPase EngA
MLPLVALVGRPNVGKSTLFNALTRSRDALVHDEPGVTRDRNYGVCRLDEARPFVIVDTGGIAGQEDGLAGATARQSRAAAEEADLVLFIVDGREGPSALDDEILRWLRKADRPTVLVVNKTDGIDTRAALAEFSRYGIADVLPISSAHRVGLDQLLADVLQRLPEQGEAEVLDNDPERMRIAFVGRPNVGKSTLVNRILGEERMIASEVPGTTRDAIAVDLERDGRKYRLIDTAGIRRKSKVEEAVEKFSIVKTLQAIEQCQVAVIMLDASEGVTEQDASVLGAVLDAGRALVVAVNKWDGLTGPKPCTSARNTGPACANSSPRSIARTIPRPASSAPRKSPRRWKSPTPRTRRPRCAATSRRCVSRIRAARIRRPSWSTARACAICRRATGAISRTSSASASNWSARRCVSCSARAKTPTRTRRTCSPKASSRSGSG